MSTIKPASKPANTSRSLSALGIVLLLLGAGLTYYVLMPGLITAREELANSKAELAGIQADVVTLNSAKQQLTSAKAELTAKGVDFASIPNHFPATEMMPDMYIQMESVLKSANYVNKFEYTIAAPVIDPLTQKVKIPVSVTAIGQYPEIKRLITTLQTQIRPILISQASLAAYTNTDQPANSYTFVAAGYSLVSGVSSAFAVNPAK